ncbi:hypothetical protein [uncultured Cohaesibacter sp.]|uniref:hypothetical protein n=1 Tax=uncultured Cohaesibacter sp. TaxID=1002546 RepID=UPI00292E19FB|nr:hypothetical protein [uncultured Cohaesibacter sp.]
MRVGQIAPFPEGQSQSGSVPFRALALLLAALSLLIFSWGISTQPASSEEIPKSLLNNHRATMGCWLADIDNSELADKALVIHLGVQTFYGFVCSSGLNGDSYRIYQVEDGRDEWANLITFPQLDVKLGWYAITELQKPTWDEKKKLLRAEFPKQGSTSSCRQYSIYSWQNDRFFIAQIGLSGDCEEKDTDKDLIIYPFVDEVEKGKASGLATTGDISKDAGAAKEEGTATEASETPDPEAKSKAQ